MAAEIDKDHSVVVAGARRGAGVVSRQHRLRNNKGGLYLFKTIFFVALTISVLVQIFVDSSLENVLCASMAASAGILSALYCLRKTNVPQSAISSLIILGFSIHSTSAALLVQSIYITPVVYNLQAPVATFSICAAFQIIAIVTHVFYRNSLYCASAKNFIRTRVYGPLGIFRSPSNGQLWLIGLVGAFASWFTNADRWGEDNYGNIGFKALQAFAPFAVAPFLIPLGPFLYDRPNTNRKSDLVPIVLYSLLMLYIAIARNSRGAFAVNILVVGLCVFLAIFVGRLALTPRRKKIMFVTAIVCVIFSAMFSNLSLAMLAARAERSDISSSELVWTTIEKMSDQAALQGVKDRQEIVEGYYNENYVSSGILNRFVFTKYIDLNINLINGISMRNLELARQSALDRLTLMLPTPLVRVIDPNLDKAANSYSSGDYYNYLVKGDTLGGFRTGSSLADGSAIFGVVYVAVFGLLALAVFILCDALTVNTRSGIVVSVFAAFNIARWFMNGLMDESVAAQVGYLIRGLPQALLLFSAAMFFTKWIRRL